jgi:hypothetical protein
VLELFQEQPSSSTISPFTLTSFITTVLMVPATVFIANKNLLDTFYIDGSGLQVSDRHHRHGLRALCMDGEVDAASHC